MHPIDASPADSRTLRRFAFQLGVILLLIQALLLWRGSIDKRMALVGTSAVLGFIAAGAWRPAWVRPVHAGSVALSVWMGKYVGGVGLTVFFFVVLTPLGLVLRLFGHDPLSLRKRKGAASYWQPARKPGPLDRMF
jgi:hypothetical protein